MAEDSLDSSKVGTAETEPSQLDALSALSPSFDDAAIEALDPWRLGDYVPCPPLVWAAVAGVRDEVTGRAALAGEGLTIDSLTPAAGALAVICSQTCDVIGEGPGAKHAFVQVSPVYDYAGTEDDEEWQRLVNGEVWHAFGIKGPDQTPLRVVDLRISVPVSKQHLVNSTRRFAFATYEGAGYLAEHLGARLERASMHDFLGTTVRDGVAVAVSRRKKTNTWLQRADEVRVTIKGDPLAPSHAGLFVIFHSEPSDTELQQMFEFGQSFKKGAVDCSIRWMDAAHASPRSSGIQAYRDSSRLYLPGLRRP